MGQAGGGEKVKEKRRAEVRERAHRVYARWW